MLQIRPDDLEIPADNPFRNDALERAKLEPPLTEFVCQARGPFVLAIDGGWGTGKTTFIRMWQAKLVERGCTCLYFNAWETDFAADPLVALVGELSAAITGPKVAPVKARLKQLTGSIMRRSIPVALRLMMQGIGDLDSLTEDQLGELVAEVAKDQVESYVKAKSELASFRQNLEKLVSKAQLRGGSASGNVVVFVDELDRCRPSYAVELLERVKHLFDVAGIVFVLGVDRRQLAHSIGVLYGSSFDAEDYLRRFIDADYRLPDPPVGAYHKHLFNILGIRALVLSRSSQLKTAELEGLEDVLGTFFRGARMSLRRQLQIVFSAPYRSADDPSPPPPL